MGKIEVLNTNYNDIENLYQIKYIDSQNKKIELFAYFPEDFTDKSIVAYIHGSISKDTSPLGQLNRQLSIFFNGIKDENCNSVLLFPYGFDNYSKEYAAALDEAIGDIRVIGNLNNNLVPISFSGGGIGCVRTVINELKNNPDSIMKNCFLIEVNMNNGKNELWTIPEGDLELLKEKGINFFYFAENSDKYGGHWADLYEDELNFIRVECIHTGHASGEILEYFVNYNWLNFATGEEDLNNLAEALQEYKFTKNGKELTYEEVKQMFYNDIIIDSVPNFNLKLNDMNNYYFGEEVKWNNEVIKEELGIIFNKLLNVDYPEEGFNGNGLYTSSSYVPNVEGSVEEKAYINLATIIRKISVLLNDIKFIDASIELLEKKKESDVEKLPSSDILNEDNSSKIYDKNVFFEYETIKNNEYRNVIEKDGYKQIIYHDGEKIIGIEDYYDVRNTNNINAELEKVSNKYIDEENIDSLLVNVDKKDGNSIPKYIKVVYSEDYYRDMTFDEYNIN